MGVTKIQWTSTPLPDGTLHHGFSFNTHQGCVEQGAECDNCYARELAHRFRHDIWGHDKPRKFQSDKYWQQPYKWQRQGEKLQTRLKVFANSMSDLFENRTDLIEPRKRLYKTIGETGWLNWLLLTKLPNNIPVLAPNDYLPNVWYGASCGVDKSRWRIDRLRKQENVPVRFLSIEPLLEPLPFLDLTNIDWVVVGGESGAKARPCKLEWIDNIVLQCEVANIPVFVKQLGTINSKVMKLKDWHGGDIEEFPEHLRVRQFPDEALKPRQPKEVLPTINFPE